VKLNSSCMRSVLLLAVAVLLQNAHGQVTAAAIHGTVTDPAGAVLPNADIVVLNTSTGVSVNAKSDNAGFFKLTQLQPGGPYSVSVVSSGFSKFVASGIRLTVNDDREINAKLSVGATA